MNEADLAAVVTADQDVLQRIAAATFLSIAYGLGRLHQMNIDSKVDLDSIRRSTEQLVRVERNAGKVPVRSREHSAVSAAKGAPFSE